MVYSVKSARHKTVGNRSLKQVIKFCKVYPSTRGVLWFYIKLPSDLGKCSLTPTSLEWAATGRISGDARSARYINVSAWRAITWTLPVYKSIVIYSDKHTINSDLNK